jgi:hypothetical protein
MGPFETERIAIQLVCILQSLLDDYTGFACQFRDTAVNLRAEPADAARCSLGTPKLKDCNQSDFWLSRLLT